MGVLLSAWKKMGGVRATAPIKNDVGGVEQDMGVEIAKVKILCCIMKFCLNFYKQPKKISCSRKILWISKGDIIKLRVQSVKSTGF